MAARRSNAVSCLTSKLQAASHASSVIVPLMSPNEQFTLFIEDNQAFWLACLYKWMKSQDADAEDLLQEAILRFWALPDHGLSLQYPRAYFLQMLRNKMISHLRRRTRFSPLPPDVCSQTDEPEFLDYPETLDHPEALEALEKCLVELEKANPNHYEAVRLRFLESLTHTQAMERLKVPSGTEATWLRRGLAGLRRTFSKFCDDGK